MGIGAAGLIGLVLIVVATLADPFVLTWTRGLDEGWRAGFRSVTDIGRSGWMLALSGGLFIGLGLLRKPMARAARSGLVARLRREAAFVFATVAVTGLVVMLAKFLIGRARPKLFAAVGHLDFTPLTLGYDHASFPSGHAAGIFALAASVSMVRPAIAWPMYILAGFIAATRVLIGAHYLSDVLAGAMLAIVVARMLRARVPAWLGAGRASIAKSRRLS